MFVVTVSVFSVTVQIFCDYCIDIQINSILRIAKDYEKLYLIESISNLHIESNSFGQQRNFEM